MGKRLIDTQISKKVWFYSLPACQKLAFIYLLLECDPVGVWDGNRKYIESLVGECVDWDALLKSANGNITLLDSGKWWITDFCAFQYGDIREVSKSSVQKALRARLLTHGLWDIYLSRVDATVDPTVGDTVATRVAPTHKEKEKEKEKEKDKEKEKESLIQFDFKTGLFENITDEHVERWQGAYPALDVDQQIIRMGEWLMAHPEKRKKNYRRFITGWLSRSQERGGK